MIGKCKNISYCTSLLTIFPVFLCKHYKHQLTLCCHSHCFPDFNCSATAGELKTQLGKLTKLKYNVMMGSLYAKDVITDNEREIIDSKIGEEKMMYLILDIIIRSLRLDNCKKYKGFLEAMEESDDTDLRSMAEKLGELITSSKI